MRYRTALALLEACQEPVKDLRKYLRSGTPITAFPGDDSVVAGDLVYVDQFGVVQIVDEHCNSNISICARSGHGIAEIVGTGHLAWVKASDEFINQPEHSLVNADVFAAYAPGLMGSVTLYPHTIQEKVYQVGSFRRRSQGNDLRGYVEILLLPKVISP